MLPFTISLRSGLSIHEQVVYAVERAVVAGQLRPGDPFPSVRALSQDLGINPNTAHRIVATLISKGALDVRPGTGTFVAKPPSPSRADRSALLDGEVERMVVEARRLSLDLDELVDAVRDHWNRLHATTKQGRQR